MLKVCEGSRGRGVKSLGKKSHGFRDGIGEGGGGGRRGGVKISSTRLQLISTGDKGTVDQSRRSRE